MFFLFGRKSAFSAGDLTAAEKVLAEESKKALNVCDFFSKGTIYLLAFLLPIFFLPWTASVLDFNKQLLLMILVFVSLFAWIIKVLISGRLGFNLTGFHIPVGLLFFISLFSTIFSLWRYGSFWGWPLVTSESLLSLMSLSLLYFLIANIFKKKDVFWLMIILAVSGFLTMAYGLLQAFGAFILPWNFTKAVSFNTVGTFNELGVFAAVLTPLAACLLIASKKWILKIFLVLVLVLALAVLVLVNFSVIWWMLIISAGLIMVFALQKADLFDNRWLILPMFFLAVSLFFLFFGFRIPGLPAQPIEVFLSQGTSFNIAWETLKERPIFGSGPGTFIYDFSEHKDKSFNQNAFWNVRFDRAKSKVLDSLATTGILGLLSFVSVMALFIFYSIKFLFRRREDSGGIISERFLWMLGVGIFIGFIAVSVNYFLYTSTLTADFIFFLLMGSFIALLSPYKKELILRPSSLLTLAVTFAFTLVFIFGLGLFILEGQRYVAEINYFLGLKNWQEGKTDEALVNLQRAATINFRMDLYWRELSQAYLQKVNEEALRRDLSQEEVSQRVQALISNIISTAVAATDSNPVNVANWSVRGFVYRSLIGVVNGVTDWSVKAYEEALRLEPTNPYYPVQAGLAYLRGAERLGDENKEEKAKLLESAKEQFKKAIELKSDYAAAQFQLAMVYQSQGKAEEAVAELEKTKSLAPFDIGLAFQLGLVYYNNKNYDLAQSEFERALLMNSDYANALYFLGLTYYQQGKNEKAIEKIGRVFELNPDNKEVKTVLDNLKAGRPALEGVVQQVPPTVPIENTPPEVEEKTESPENSEQ